MYKALTNEKGVFRCHNSHRIGITQSTLYKLKGNWARKTRSHSLYHFFEHVKNYYRGRLDTGINTGKSR